MSKEHFSLPPQDVLEVNPNTERGSGVDLSTLINFNAEGATRKILFQLTDIQKYLYRQKGVHLPIHLIEQLGLDKLNWQLVYHPDALPFLFLGGEERVVAVGYNCFHRLNPLDDLNVSVSHSEFPGDLHPSCSTSYLARLVKDSIPTDQQRPYHLAGLITQTMRNRTNYHHVLRLWDSTHADHGINFGNYGSFTLQLGFRVKSSDSSHTVVFEPPPEKQLPSWRISVPRHLEKSQ